jgi:hypothetical protein
MRRLSTLTLIFAFLSVVFFLLLIFLRIPFPLYPLMSYQDAFDLLTPLVLIPIYWRLYKEVTCNRSTQASEMGFMVFAGIWAAGQGMHLSANSINNLIGNLAKQAAIDITGTQIYTLTYFYDEYLSHYLWHIGVIGLAALLVYEGWRRPSDEATDWRRIIPGAVLYGFLLFSIFLEGNTLPIGLPFLIVVTLAVLIAGRRKLRMQPVLAFFFASCALALLMIAGWWLYWGCLPPILDPYHC